ncbi:nuclear transport factor 2 family protein [Nostoc sp. MG11]|uniref:nuclear transport factor 2 family protein n=1 Tax=Nostoc sp. MG11 TaxID=2721166 RepID=UPI001D01A928|nr:nuclear transport factor 2 family protein [Nostoc sp. MG11]
MALEQKFWEASSAANVDLIRGYLTNDALTVGTFGVLNKETTIAVNEGQPPFFFWRIVDAPRILQLTTDSAVVIYKATAQRQGREPFTIMISSTYVSWDGSWKLAFHHQTPL